MTRRLLPSGIVLVVAFFAVVLVRTTLPLIDGDVWWHLRAGETVLASGAVPATDTWTIAGQGMRWTSQDWLTNVAMAAILHAGGSTGTTLLSLAFGLVAVVAFALLWDAIRRRHPGGSWVGRILLLTAGLVVAGPILGVRVQTVDLLLTAVTVWLLWGFLADRRRGWLAGLPLAAVAWANLHAGWPLLFALGGGVVVGELGDRLLRRSVAGRAPLTGRQLVELGAALAVSVPLLLLNPNGIDLLGYPLATATIGAHRDFIFEWSRPDLATFPGQAILAFIMLVIGPTLVVGRRSLRLADVLWLIGLSVLALGAVRFALVLGPVGAAVAAVTLAPAIGGRVGGRLRMFQRPPRTATLAVLNLGLATLVAIGGLVVGVARVTPATQVSAIREAMPVEAAAWLARDGSARRIFNVYAWGGYLGRELPGALVYIDGRSDIYGDGPIRAYARAIALETDPATLLDGAAIDTVVFWPDAVLADWLDDHGWQRRYEDEVAAVWQRAKAAP